MCQLKIVRSHEFKFFIPTLHSLLEHNESLESLQKVNSTHSKFLIKIKEDLHIVTSPDIHVLIY